MRKVTKEQIINWLESRGIREQFEKNHKTHMSRQSGISEDQYSLDKYFDNFMRLVDREATSMEKFISGCFIWCVTPEGHEYWWKIEDEFKEWLNSLEETSPVKDSSPNKVTEDSPKVASRTSTSATASEVYDLFKDFLENHNTSVAEFEDNLKNDYFRGKSSECTEFKSYIADQCKKYSTVKNLIVHGFVLADTPQGWRFWSDLSLEWEEFCKEHKI